MNRIQNYHLDNNFIKLPVDFGEISLVQVGRRFCNGGDIIAAHTHLDWFELTVALGGDAVVRTNDTLAQVSPGEIHLSLPCEIHEITPNKTSGFEYDFFAFVCNDKTLRARLEGVIHRIAESGKRVFRDERIEFLIGCATNELAEGIPDDTKVLQSIFSLIVSYLIRDVENLGEARVQASKNKAICYKIMNYIDTHVYSMNGTGEIANDFGYSYNYLSTLFTKTTGKTISDYYTERRLELAKILVFEGEKKVWEIAELLHYSSPFALTKAFTARYGISPKKMQMNRMSENEE